MKKINITVDDKGKIDVKMEGTITYRDFKNIRQAMLVGFKKHLRTERLADIKKTETKFNVIKEK